MNEFAVIVDAFSTGRLLLKEFIKHGHKCIHVQSSAKVSAYYKKLSPNSKLFEKIFIFDGNMDFLESELRKYNILSIVPGAEIGVELADILSEKFGLATNGTKLSLARRNKYLMSDKLRVNGVNSIKQIRTKIANKAKKFSQKIGNWPIVLKPIDSAGADGFTLTYSTNELEKSFLKLMSKEKLVGGIVEDILVQEYLVGTEFVINAVSWEGKHYISDIWKCKKKMINNTKIYDFEDLISPNADICKLLSDYIRQVLDILDIKYGPSHSEVIVTKNGPVLIETGARLCGGLLPSVGDQCLGYSQLGITIECYTGDFNFDKINNRKSLKKHSRCITLISPVKGTLTKTPEYSFFEKLESFHSIDMNLKAGSKINLTIDLASAPGLIFLVHEDIAIIEKEYEAIRLFEKEFFTALIS